MPWLINRPVLVASFASWPDLSDDLVRVGLVRPARKEQLAVAPHAVGSMVVARVAEIKVRVLQVERPHLQQTTWEHAPSPHSRENTPDAMQSNDPQDVALHAAWRHPTRNSGRSANAVLLGGCVPMRAGSAHTLRHRRPSPECQRCPQTHRRKRSSRCLGTSPARHQATVARGQQINQHV